MNRVRASATVVSRKLRGLGVGTACGLLAWFVTAATPCRMVEEWAHDSLFSRRGDRPTTARVVLVEIDEASVVGIKKPLTQISPELAKVVRHVLKCGATAVAVDLLVPEELSDVPAFAALDGPGEGYTLGRVALDTERVIFPVRQGVNGPIRPLRSWWLAKQAINPGTTDFGFADVQEDLDQTLRRQRLVFGGEGGTVPQLGLALFARSRGEVPELDSSGRPSVGGRPVPVDADGMMRVNFVARAGAFPAARVSFQDALFAAAGSGKGFPAPVDGAVVIVGITDPRYRDYHPTPVSNGYAGADRMAGAEYHAHVYATLHDGAFVTTPWWLAPGPLVVGCGAVLGFVFARLRLEVGFLVAAAHHFAWKALALVAFTQVGWRVEIIGVVTAGALAYAATFLVRWWQLRRMFGVVKSEAIARALEADPDRLNPGGEERVVTVLFADVRQFTDYSDRHAPVEVVGLLNAYFAAVVPAVEAEGGTVMCYLGDGLMAVFGAPASQPDHAARAVRAAVAMARAVASTRTAWAGHDRSGVWAARGGLRIGVGVHTGSVVVGAIGSPGRRDYTVIGDAVNVAARLEAATKELGTEVAVSSDTFGRVPPADRAGLGLTGTPVDVEVRGKTDRLSVYTLPHG